MGMNHRVALLLLALGAGCSSSSEPEEPRWSQVQTLTLDETDLAFCVAGPTALVLSPSAWVPESQMNEANVDVFGLDGDRWVHQQELALSSSSDSRWTKLGPCARDVAHLRGIALVSTASEALWFDGSRWAPGGPLPFDTFALARNGSLAVVDADSIDGLEVWRRQGDAYQRDGNIDIPFGVSRRSQIAVGTDTIAVGRSPAVVDEPAEVDIYEPVQGGWVATQTIVVPIAPEAFTSLLAGLAPHPGPNIALDGDHIVIGNLHAAHFYERQNGTWQPVDVFVPSEADPWWATDGMDVRLVGDVAVASAPYGGSIHILERLGGWVETHRLTANRYALGPGVVMATNNEGNVIKVYARR